LLKVRVEFNERYGLKLSVEDIDTTFTIGQLELKRREILQQLGALGLMDKNKGHALPPVLQRLAVISSEKAAGFHDFIQHLQANDYGFAFECELYTAAMQGRNVEKEILGSFQEIRQARRPYDAVIIIRGGGSRLDLAAFDSLQLCVAIANLEYPVITGIGHETDQAVADLVAHTSLKTPTAVAHFILEHNFKFETQLYAGYRILQKSALEIIESFESRLRRQSQMIKEVSLRRLSNENYFLAAAKKDLKMHTLQLLREKQAELHSLQQRTTLMDPELLLKRGYSMTFKDGVLLKRPDQTESGDLIETRLSGGSIRSTVK
jgi:exodeoxyribonuclease VII large subunit